MKQRILFVLGLLVFFGVLALGVIDPIIHPPAPNEFTDQQKARMAGAALMVAP